MKNGIENSKQGAFAMLDPNSGFSQYGLTKREYFAAMAIQGILSNSKESTVELFEDVAEVSIKYADELLIQLDKK